MQTQLVSVVHVKTGRQPHSLVADAEGVLVLRVRAQREFHDTAAAFRIGVFEAVGDQFVHNQSQRQGSINVQKHWVKAGREPNGRWISNVSREQQRAEAG